MSKIKSLEEILEIVDASKKSGKIVVSTNGCFDILHIGHIRYLERAKKLGDILIVGVNSDESVKLLKGVGRPVVPLNERMEVLSALSCIDYVFPFNELRPFSWLERVKPDIHVKGGDYPQDMIDRPVVERYGGKLVIIDKTENKSTTDILEKMRSTQEKGEFVSNIRMFSELSEPKYQSIIKEVASKCAMAIKNGNKIVLFGNGGSATDALHVAGEFIGKFGKMRPSLPAIALTENIASITAIANDFGYEHIFSRQIEGLIKPRDIAIGISTSGNSPNVIEGILKAKGLGAFTIGLTGIAGKRLEEVADMTLKVPSSETPRIQEAHISICHTICKLVEDELYG